jgi:hypothetical protein
MRRGCLSRVGSGCDWKAKEVLFFLPQLKRSGSPFGCIVSRSCSCLCVLCCGFSSLSGLGSSSQGGTIGRGEFHGFGEAAQLRFKGIHPCLKKI